MKKTWQIWSLFFFSVLAVAIAMSWLSLKTIRLDALRETDRAETELARREAELQERVSSALYRMDLKMLPLVAQEAARPQNFYQSFYDVIPPDGSVDQSAEQTESRSGKLHLASPLLFPSSDFVLLHFEIDSENVITSPQFPVGNERNVAMVTYHVSETALESTLTKINKARQLFDYQTLLQKDMAVDGAVLVDSSSSTLNPNVLALAYNVPAVENFRNQIQNQTTEPTNNNSANRIEQQRSRADQRINSGFNQRRDSTQELTQLNAINSNSINNIGYGLGNGLDPQSFTWPSIGESLPSLPMQPIWLGENLILARQIVNDKRNVIQCCWLNWEKIEVDLKSEVRDLLPDLQFEAVTSETELKIGTALTTIPVQIMVDRAKMLAMLAFDSPDVAAKSVLPVSLIAAWCCLGLAAITSALLLNGVLRLSERRAAFVSAVTHELRTPLTTFRMYSEMLADGMVPPEKQQQYANTLKVQADRLSHLVENVLQFARLERGSAKIALETVTVGELSSRFRSRLEERAADSEMQLVFDLDETTSKRSLVTQPAAIEQILFNLVDNACKYAQASNDKRIVVSVGQSSSRIQFSVRDFGPGIKPSDRKRMFEPFQQSATATANAIPGVGLGLSLCDRMARSLGGRLIDKPCTSGALFVLEICSANE